MINKPTDIEVVRAIQEVLRVEKRPLAFWRIAEALEISEHEVAAILLRSMRSHNAVIDFRYPPLPIAAVCKIEVCKGDRN